MQDTMAVFAVNSALIGLSCALSEFGELLELGRELSTCITACPGLARVSEGFSERYHLTGVK